MGEVTADHSFLKVVMRPTMKPAMAPPMVQGISIALLPLVTMLQV